ncbi:hypothetical protein RV11_GL000600 [Enterococcus phoeniculicola]|jgi:hypothetical protein|uniref:DUF3784 domain-containing protein n=1 Tax=Enterococcus phoeniculicola ATCC BAA-412 TaxID=1158610 RepID=R3WMV2_9ENTE|nr:hypothetical protein [Enterococcus phoeniculicola]EOL43185.1 hypothetical protein UC3_02162 [Enterococcus phoeniculicola ATCC BAA-412]EOT76457.1 hypothetical protein I589_01414 [Enterococcus phoeniculicola ATCC BAA-412]OJG71075.1 hypothetical protein RV11_GL000600 [Enterococcus phoeniculicola]
MFSFLITGICLLLAFLFLLLGIQFHRGKWVLLIAGVTKSTPKELAQKNGKVASYCMYFAFIYCLLLGLSFLMQQTIFLRGMIILGILVGIGGIVYALKEWVKNG